ncbi:MAG: hypothetical protein ACK5YI_15495 [Rhodospirillales bacterium]|jgi:hypothetical protein
MDVRILLLLAGLALALVAIAVAALRVTGDLAGQDLGSAPLALAVAGVVMVALMAGFIWLARRGR